MDPAVAGSCADPVGSAAGAVETALAQLISRSETADLLTFSTKPVTEELGRLTAEYGISVEAIVVDGIETELTPGLLGLATHTKYRNQT